MHEAFESDELKIDHLPRHQRPRETKAFSGLEHSWRWTATLNSRLRVRVGKSEYIVEHPLQSGTLAAPPHT